MTKLQPITGPLLSKIVTAVSDLKVNDLSKLKAWATLRDLSPKTSFESIEANPDGVFFDAGNNQFEAIANVYVTLQHGGGARSTSMSDSYPARVTGEVTPNGGVRIQSIDVDTTAFDK